MDYPPLNKLNERENFRIELWDKVCEVHFLDFDNGQLSSLKYKNFDASLDNISLGGLKFVCAYNLPVNRDIIVEIRFTIKQNYFSLKGEILRKEEHKGKEVESIRYGVKFLELSAEDKERLHFVLNQLMLEKKDSAG
ncbi:PilZ domain-containing protein [Radiobacillus kanasensis]|uniref:PilZ domain-containing protein n=1 Tax=Radiobacillus kanasensis TaxID=2844358 RepID=UPI001E53833A|nr:PilZ domain-containing protein [Radiobacillus kanasensis]UFU00156.1 PilZ domain-containing protein [Radiobacillus kanasensis]